MAIAFRAASNPAPGSGGSMTGTEPTGTVQNDVLVAAFAVEDNSTTITPPAGWTTLFTGGSPSAGGSGFEYWIGYVVRGASAPSLTWGISAGSAFRELYLLCFSGCDTTTPVDASAATTPNNANPNNPNPPAATASAATDMGIAVGYNWAGPSGTWVHAAYTIRGPNNFDIVLATRSLSASGSEDPAAFTGALGTAADGLAATILLKAPGGATPSGSGTSTAGATSVATGRRVGQRAPVSSAGAASTETGRRVARGAATSTSGAASTATGGQPVIAHSGTATTTAGAASTATGRRVSRSAPASTAGAASTVTTRRVSQSSHEEVSAAPPFTITVAGVLTSAVATSTAAGTAAGVETHSGAASTSAGATSAASGRRKALRSALSSSGATSAASGRRVSRGAPLTTAAAASTSTARRISRGSCATTAGAASSASGTSNGVPTRNGSASTTAGAASTATGRRVSRGACISANAAASTVGWRRVSRGSGVTSAGAASVAVGGLPGAHVVFGHIEPGGSVGGLSDPSSGVSGVVEVVW